jgi:hypothetical protein
MAHRRSNAVSPHLHYEIARVRQQEIAASVLDAHRRHNVRGTDNPRRPVRQHFGQVASAVAVCVAATIAVTTGGAPANPRTVKASGHVSAQQFAREIRALEAKGYLPASCTIGGTLMRNYRTGQLVTVKQ